MFFLIFWAKISKIALPVNHYILTPPCFIMKSVQTGAAISALISLIRKQDGCRYIINQTVVYTVSTLSIWIFLSMINPKLVLKLNKYDTSFELL